jgi:hypothetical protein
MGRARLRLPIFYAFLAPALILSLLSAAGIGSTSVGWPVILRVVGSKLLPSGWVHLNDITRADP